LAIIIGKTIAAFKNQTHYNLDKQLVSLKLDFILTIKNSVSDWEKFIEVHNQAEVRTSIRENPAKSLGGETRTQKRRIPWAEHGYYLNQRPSFTLDPLIHAGAYYVQEASSMLLEQAVKQAVDLAQPSIVLDLCAAPGGKSTHLLSLLNADSLLISNDVIRSRASILSENIQKWGYENVVVTNNDPQDFKKLTGFFDLIVVDAPCSGEGLFRKEPEAMNEWSEENVMLCSQRQQRILADVLPALKQEGILIYSTCTYNEKENEDNLVWLDEQMDVDFVQLKLEASWGIEEVKKGRMVGYRCYPHRVSGEGFFISVMRKKSPEETIIIRSKNSFQGATKKNKEALSDWLLPHEAELVMLNELIVSLPSKYITEIDFLSRTLKTVLKGTAITTQKHDKFIPEHSLALSIHLNKSNFKIVELTLEQALAYLRKEVLMIGEGERGFALVTYQNTPLGWVNLLGNRVNNLYPSGWRILMR